MKSIHSDHSGKRTGKPADAMQHIMTTILTQHNLDLPKLSTGLTLLRPGRDSLTITRLKQTSITIAYRMGNGADAHYDSEITCALQEGQWIPIEVTNHRTGCCKQYAEFRSDGTLNIIDASGQTALAKISDWWAHSIETHGWLDAKC